MGATSESEIKLFEPENGKESESKSDVVNGPSFQEKTKTWLFLFLLLLVQDNTGTGPSAGSCHPRISEIPSWY